MSTVADVAVAALRATGKPTGDGVAKNGNTDLTPPYWVVYPIHSTFDGPATSPDEDRSPRIQVTSVAHSRGMAQKLAADAETVLKGPLSAPSGYVYAGPVVLDESRGVQRDDDANPVLFWAVDWYRFDLTPA